MPISPNLSDRLNPEGDRLDALADDFREQATEDFNNGEYLKGDSENTTADNLSNLASLEHLAGRLLGSLGF